MLYYKINFYIILLGFVIDLVELKMELSLPNKKIVSEFTDKNRLQKIQTD